MSAPVTAEVLRELGARRKTFHSVRGALLWYRSELARRLQCTRQGFEAGAGSCSATLREERAATFAAVASCLKARSEDDEEVAAALRGECVAWLLASYEARWGDNTFLADRANLSRWAFTRRCARTERFLRVRMVAAGILEGRA